MAPEQVVKLIVVLFVLFVVFLAISKGGRRQTR
jgi:hypothetical protein